MIENYLNKLKLKQLAVLNKKKSKLTKKKQFKTVSILNQMIEANDNAFGTGKNLTAF